MRSSRSGPDPLDPGPAGFAHRGLHGPGVPENSIAAFRAALAIGAGIECDVRLSGDGQVMIHHDHETRRLTGAQLFVESTPAEHLAGLRLLGSIETIPWLSELLDLVQGAVPLLVEVKTEGRNAEDVAAAVAADLADYAGPVGVMSYEPKVARYFARHHPYRRRGLVVGRRNGWLDRWAAVGIARPHFVAVNHSYLGGRWAERMRQRCWLYSWTVDSAALRAQAAVHADALIWEGDGRP